MSSETAGQDFLSPEVNAATKQIPLSELVEDIDAILDEANKIDPGVDVWVKLPEQLRTREHKVIYRDHNIAYGLRWAAQMLGWDTDREPWCSR